MKRVIGTCIAVLCWALLVGSVAAWVRSRHTFDDLAWKRLRGDGGFVRETSLLAQSARGGVRLAVRWGTQVDHGDAMNRLAYGAPGFARAAGPASDYPAAAEPSAAAAGAGFGVEYGEYPWRWPGALRTRWVGVVLPYWFVTALAAAVSLRWLLRARREATAAALGRCGACGYDLRATPERCPECGAAATSASPTLGAAVVRLPVRVRVVAASMLLLPLAIAGGLHAAGFFAAPVAQRGPAPAPLPWVSPTVWAAQRNPLPAGFAAYTETIPGNTPITFTMVPVPGGRFRMGSPPDEPGRDEKSDDEGPQVDVLVEPFYMGRCEVTQAEYDEFLAGYSTLGGLGAPQVPRARWVDAVTYPTPLYELEAGPIFQRMGRGGQYPAVMMSHYAACQYTKWLSRKTGRFYRLATEAEWEYACRAGTTTAYSFGDDPAQLEHHGWFYDNSEQADGELAYARTGLKRPNAWGLYDMHGNVAEWVIDGYSRDHYRGLAAELAATTAGGAVPAPAAVRWPTKRYQRVVRGGGYESEAADCRSAARLASTPKFNNKDPELPRSVFYEASTFWVGFRVVCPVREPSDAEKQRYWAGDDPGTLRDLSMRGERQIRELLPPYP